MDFKFTTRFFSQAKVVEEPPALFKEQAFASLQELKALLPADINPEESPDILYIASNLVKLNVANYNGDCVPTGIGKEVYKKWTNKLVDIEHDRKKIVGFVLNAALVKADTNEIIDVNEVDNYDGDIDIAYAAAIWKLASPKLCSFIIEASDEKSQTYGAVSSSLELGFNTYMIAVGPTRNLQDAKILTDPKEIKKYEAFLQAKKGRGVDGQGNYVYRVVTGTILPTGVGLVANPASQVKGVLALPNDDIEENDDAAKISEGKVDSGVQGQLVHVPVAATMADIEALNAEKLKASLAANNEKNSPITENQPISSVNLNNPTTMTKISKVEDIVGSLFKEEATASTVTQFIVSEIEKSSQTYVKQLEEQKDISKKLQEAKASIEQNAAKTKEEAEKLQAKVTELADKLNQIEEAKASAQADADFNDHMKAFDEEYDLDEDDRKVLATEIKACKTKEEFAAFTAKMKPLMKEKSKAAKKAKAEQMKCSLQSAAKGLDITKLEVDEKTLNFKEIVAAVKPVAGQENLPNATPPATEDTLAVKMQKAFGGNIRFNGKAPKK